MTTTAPATGKPHQESHGKTLFSALLLGILCTLCIYTYSTNNLDILGLSPETQKARTLEIIVLLIGQTFLSFAIGKVYEQNPAWAYKLGFILVILFIVDFSGSYQARNAINQSQTLTKSATEEHAKLIAAQIGVTQNAAKELTDSAQRQRNNKFITAGAANANKAAKQADSATDLIKLHGEAIKSIKPTEADTFGAWTGNIIFMSMLGLYLLNDAMWAFIGHFVGRSHEAAERTTIAPSAPAAPAQRSEIATPERSDSATAPRVDFDLEKAREAVKRKNQTDRMPKVMPWHFAVPAAAITATGAHAMPAPQPPAPTEQKAPENVAESLQQVKQNRYTKATPKQAGKQMDTGTKGKAAGRYERLKKMVAAGQVKPSINALYALDSEHVSKPTAREYLDAMERDGVVIKDGRGWKVVNHA